MSEPITFSNLQDLHTKLWNNANNRWFSQNDNDQKRKIYTQQSWEETIYEYLIFPETPSEEATNLKVEGATYGIPWDSIKQGWIKVKASLDEVWWIYDPRPGSRGGRKKTRRKKRRKKKTKKRRKKRRRKKRTKRRK